MARASPTLLTVSAFFPLPPSEAFPALLDELEHALGGRRLRLDPRPGGALFERLASGKEVEVARIAQFDPGLGIVLDWHPPSWAKGSARGEMEVRMNPEAGGTRVTLEHRGLDKVLGGDPHGEDLVGWFANEVASSLFRSLSPSGLADWVTDRKARRPSGSASRAVYRDPTFHRPNFGAILEGLELTPGDHLLEVGCGGGAFLADALKSGCRASAIDHSSHLLKVAAEQNEEAIASGRLHLAYSEADELPFPDGKFTCAVMTGVLGFLPQPERTLREVWRTLRPGGRLAVYCGTKALKGTPAAPYPIADRVRWYEDEEIAQLARAAGFERAEVTHPSLARYAKAAGLPPDVVRFFRSGTGNQLLWAYKPLRPGLGPRARPRAASTAGPRRRRARPSS